MEIETQAWHVITKVQALVIPCVCIRILKRKLQNEKAEEIERRNRGGCLHPSVSFTESRFSVRLHWPSGSTNVGSPTNDSRSVALIVPLPL